ncbi:MAG: Ig-like domain-containing protein [Eubacteriales bacterium]|nr:Ig-like domain-containing protein [Eubacteriales bacterium]MDD3883281.1 Ig-like domain-containing protein [Eubacteriales bacterium]MDD4513904.1 Ig-like domain-containing protein [Eubacteriales bacterium]
MNIAGGTTTLQLQTSSLPFDASQSVIWKSSNKRIATVNDNGLVTAGMNGRTGNVTITATATDGSKKKATFRLRVVRAVQSIQIRGTSTISAGSTTKLSAIITPSNATNRKIRWISGNIDIATVSKSGLVRAKKVFSVQKVKITAISEESSAVLSSIIITVVPKVQSISINGASNQINLSSPFLQLKAVCSPTGSMQNVTWSSSNKRIATVGEAGLVTAHKSGTVSITARAKDGSGKKTTYKIRVVGKAMANEDFIMYNASSDGFDEYTMLRNQACGAYYCPTTSAQQIVLLPSHYLYGTNATKITAARHYEGGYTGIFEFINYRKNGDGNIKCIVIPDTYTKIRLFGVTDNQQTRYVSLPNNKKFTLSASDRLFWTQTGITPYNNIIFAVVEGSTAHQACKRLGYRYVFRNEYLKYRKNNSYNGKNNFDAESFYRDIKAW